MATSIPDQVREALATVAEDADDRDVILADRLRLVARVIDDRAAAKLRSLLR